MMSLYIQNISTELPTNTVSNREFSFLLEADATPSDFNEDTADAWIHERSGIKSRSYFDPSQFGLGKTNLPLEGKLASKAIQKFLKKQEWETTEAILSVRSTPQHAIPSLSQRTLHELNDAFSTSEKSIFTLDSFQPSTGFLSALTVARHLPFQSILILISEHLSPHLNPRDLGTAMLFGDAVVAIHLTKTKNENTLFEVIGESFQSRNDETEVLLSEQSPSSFKMKGPELFRKIIPEFKASAHRLLERLGVLPNEIQYYLPHQANLRIIERAAHSLKFKHEQILANIESFGNLSSASTPVALHQFLNSSKFKQNDQILINACGAGLSSGSALIRKL